MTTIPFHIPSIDAALPQGGIVCGNIYEVLGPSSAGKSWLGLRAIASAQKAHLTCVLIDSEGAYAASWAKRQGVNTSELLVATPQDFSQCKALIEEVLLYSKCCDLLVIDSLDGIFNGYIQSLYDFLPYLHDLVEGSGAACLVMSQLREMGNSYYSLAEDIMPDHTASTIQLMPNSKDESGINISCCVVNGDDTSSETPSAFSSFRIDW